jgi:hypothetical protein
MTRPLANLWHRYRWARDIAEDAASSEADFGVNWEECLWEPPTSDLPLLEDLYGDLLREWPITPRAIEPSRYIHKGNAAAEDYWEREWKESADDRIQCFDWARYQMWIGGFPRVSGYRPQTTTFQVFHKDTGVDVNQTVEAVRYLQQALQAGVPVLVGVYLTYWRRVFKPDDTTNHYVVIVELGLDDDGPYLLFYDSGAEAIESKFYLKENLLIENGLKKNMIVTHVRQTPR